jgi:predicted DCC family thiol-disulfide oxidoreductase YuxK
LEEFLLVYDADCGPCSKFKRLVDWLDKYNRLHYLSLVTADDNGLLNSLPGNVRHRSFHLISPEGEIETGAGAIPGLVALFPLGRIASFLIRTSPGGEGIVNFLYSSFSRLHDTGSCGYESTSHHSPSTDPKKLLSQEARPMESQFVTVRQSGEILCAHHHTRRG